MLRTPQAPGVTFSYHRAWGWPLALRVGSARRGRTMYSFTALTAGPRRTRRRPGCPQARRSEGKPPQARDTPYMPGNGFASFLSA